MNSDKSPWGIADDLEARLEQKKKDAKILLVEDEESIRKLFESYVKLNHLSVTLDTAGTAPAGINLMKKNNYDVTILDLKLPDGWYGLNVLTELRKINKDILPIIVSGEGTLETAIEAFTEHGVYRYFTKGPKVYGTVFDSINEGLEKKAYAEFGREHNISNLKEKVNNEIKYSEEGKAGRRKEKITLRDAMTRAFMKKILVVSEDIKRRESVRGLLKDTYNVLVASNKEETHSEGDLCTDVDAVIVDPGLSENEYCGTNLLYHIRKSHSNIKRILIKGDKKVTVELVESLKQEGGIHYYVDPLEKENFVRAIEENILNGKELNSDLNNHLYLFMGPTCAGKSDLLRGLEELLKGKARTCKKYSDRPPREEEKDGKGDILPIPEHKAHYIKKKDKSILFTYKFEGHNYSIPKTILEDIQKGLDVFLISTDYKQKKHILDVFPEDIRKKIIPVMIYTDATKITERLGTRLGEEEARLGEEEARLGEEEALKRSRIIRKQVTEYGKKAHEFEYIILNDMEFKGDKTTRIGAYNELARQKFLPLRNFRSSRGDDSKDYVQYLISNLFRGMYTSVAELEEIIDKRGGADINFDEERIIEANLSWEVAQRLPKTVKQVKKAHGRVTLIFDEYEEWERRNKIIEYIEAQTKVEARYKNEDEDYKRFSAFGLLKVFDKITKQPMGEGEGINDAAVFSLTDFAGKLLTDDTPPYALNIAFLKNLDNVLLNPISPEGYKARKSELSSWEINKGINDFNLPKTS